MWNMFQSKCVTIFQLSSDDGNAHTNTGLVLPSFLSSPGRTIDTMSQSPISQLTTPVLAQHNPSYPHNTSHYTVLIFEINLRAAHYIKWKWELVNHNTEYWYMQIDTMLVYYVKLLWRRKITSEVFRGE